MKYFLVALITLPFAALNARAATPAAAEPSLAQALAASFIDGELDAVAGCLRETSYSPPSVLLLKASITEENISILQVFCSYPESAHTRPRNMFSLMSSELKMLHVPYGVSRFSVWSLRELAEKGAEAAPVDLKAASNDLTLRMRDVTRRLDAETAARELAVRLKK
jgi:hypothetical protein